MNPRQKIEIIGVEQESQPEGAANALSGLLNAPACENMNSIEQDLGLQGKLDEDWKIERLEKANLNSTHVTSSMSSYKTKIDNPAQKDRDSQALLALWTEILDIIKPNLNSPALETWIKPCKLDSFEGNIATIATSSDFNRDIISKRYRSIIQQAFCTKLDQPITLRLLVDEQPEAPPKKAEPGNQSSETAEPMQAAPYVSPVVNPKYPLARFQNPTNNPEVALLLERYGDLRQIILKSPIFKEPCAKVTEGGWGTDVAGLIFLAKQYTLERVLWAVREAKQYRGARSRGAYFNHVLRNGLETDKC